MTALSASLLASGSNKNGPAVPAHSCLEGEVVEGQFGLRHRSGKRGGEPVHFAAGPFEEILRLEELSQEPLR